jgi:hypothetical protein
MFTPSLCYSLQRIAEELDIRGGAQMTSPPGARFDARFYLYCCADASALAHAASDEAETVQLTWLSPQVSKRRRVGPEVGPTAAFCSCLPSGAHGPTCIFWANLTPFSPQDALTASDKGEISPGR